MSTPTQDVAAIISAHLEEISRLFVDNMKLTFIARNPAKFDGSQDMIITDDLLRKVQQAVRQRMAAEAPPDDPNEPRIIRSVQDETPQ